MTYLRAWARHLGWGSTLGESASLSGADSLCNRADRCCDQALCCLPAHRVSVATPSLLLSLLLPHWQQLLTTLTTSLSRPLLLFRNAGRILVLSYIIIIYSHLDKDMMHLYFMTLLPFCRMKLQPLLWNEIHESAVWVIVSRGCLVQWSILCHCRLRFINQVSQSFFQI